VNYRVIVQAEGRSADGEWFGLYAAREVPAAEEAEAVRRAKAGIEAAWDNAARGALGAVDAVAVWPAPMFSFKRCPRGGHSFYNDDADAQQEALRLEAEASGLPKRLLRRLLAGLS
jgi:hypothetical protein